MRSGGSVREGRCDCVAAACARVKSKKSEILEWNRVFCTSMLFCIEVLFFGGDLS